MDDSNYRTYVQDTNNKWTLHAESAHTLGYTPAAQIYSVPFNDLDNIRKKGPISTTISDLDFLLYFETFKRFADSYVPNPITVKYKEECNYVADNGATCNEGTVASPNPHAQGEFFYRSCPICNSTSMVGPGEQFEVQPPRNKEEFDQIDAIHFVQPPLEGIKYTTEDIDRRTELIMFKTVGMTDDQLTGQAKNIPQVMGGFDTKKTILRNVSKNLEIIMKFTHQTIARLRYADDFKGCSIFLGDEFFLETEKQLIEKYKEEKDSGNSEFELSLSRDKISQTKHKDNPNLLAKSKFLSFVEPYQGQTIDEVQTTKKDFPSLISDVDFVIKINFDRFVKRFELEEMPIGTLLVKDKEEFKVKVDTVKKKFLEYAAQLIEVPG